MRRRTRSLVEPPSAEPPTAERGAALVFVLFLLVILEVAMMMAALQIHWASTRYLLEHDRLAADRLSEAGVAHAAALLALDPDFGGAIEGTLREGTYEVTIEEPSPDRLVVTSVGRTASRRTVTLVVDLAIERRRLRQIGRERTHGMGGS